LHLTWGDKTSLLFPQNHLNPFYKENFMKKSKLLFLVIPVLALSLGCTKPVNTSAELSPVSTEEKAALKVMDGKSYTSYKQNSDKLSISTSQIKPQADEQSQKTVSLSGKTFTLLNYNLSSLSNAVTFGNDAPIAAKVYYGTDLDTTKTASYTEADGGGSSAKFYIITKKTEPSEIYANIVYKSFLEVNLYQSQTGNPGESNYSVDYNEFKAKWIDPSTKETLIEWVSTEKSVYNSKSEGLTPLELKVYHNEKTYVFYMKANLMKALEADLSNSEGKVIGRVYVGNDFTIKVKVYNSSDQLEDL